ELGQSNDRGLIVATVELVEQRVAIRTRVEKAGERKALADRRLLLRRDDDPRQLDGFVGVLLLVRRTIQRERRRGSDSRQLDPCRGEGWRAPRGWSFDADDGVVPVLFGGPQGARREGRVPILQNPIGDGLRGRGDIVDVWIVLRFARAIIRVAGDVVGPQVVARKADAIAPGETHTTQPAGPPPPSPP